MRHTMKDGARETFGTPQSIEAAVSHDAFFGPEVDAQLEQIAGGSEPEPHGCTYGFPGAGYNGKCFVHSAIHWLRTALESARDGSWISAVSAIGEARACSAHGGLNTIRWHMTLNRVIGRIDDEIRRAITGKGRAA